MRIGVGRQCLEHRFDFMIPPMYTSLQAEEQFGQLFSSVITSYHPYDHNISLCCISHEVRVHTQPTLLKFATPPRSSLVGGGNTTVDTVR